MVLGDAGMMTTGTPNLVGMPGSRAPGIIGGAGI
jgi:hypothetical protein